MVLVEGMGRGGGRGPVPSLLEEALAGREAPGSRGGWVGGGWGVSNPFKVPYNGKFVCRINGESMKICGRKLHSYKMVLFEIHSH